MDRLERIRQAEIIDDAQAEVLRRIPGARRVAMMDELCEFGRALMLARVKAAHPEWTEEQRFREVARRIAGATK